MENRHTDILIPFPEAGERHLRISVGACRLRITHGGGLDWVNGTYDDPTGVMGCRIVQEEGLARITQEPRLPGLHGWGHGVPTFTLALGAGRPYALTIETGASDTEFDLGGLPLTRLVIKLGAGKNVTRFLEPNPQPMEVLDIDAGAGALDLRMLANANFGTMALNGGASAFTFDFGGTLRREATVRLTTGLAAVEIAVPGTTAARIKAEAMLGHIEAGDGFTTREAGYWTAPAIAGVTPALSINANVALGTLRLRAT